MGLGDSRLAVTTASLGLGVLAGIHVHLPFARAFESVVDALLLGVAPLVFATVAASVADADGRSLLGVKVGWYVAAAYLAAVLATAFTAVVVGAAPDGPVPTAGWSATIRASGVVVAVGLGIVVGSIARTVPAATAVTTAADRATGRLARSLGRTYPVVAFLGGASLGDSTGALAGTVRLYLALTGLVVVVSAIWQGGWVVAATGLTDFEPGAFARYYADVFAVPFSTASEAVSIPYNVASGRRHLPLAEREAVDLELDFVLGGALNTPGSVMNGVVFAGAVPHFVFGYTPSVGTLLVVGLVAATVLSASPGVPGELALLLPTVEALVPVGTPGLAAAWLGLQVGLPDAVRSTVNVTDDAVYLHFFERIGARREATRSVPGDLEPEYGL